MKYRCESCRKRLAWNRKENIYVVYKRIGYLFCTEQCLHTWHVPILSFKEIDTIVSKYVLPRLVDDVWKNMKLSHKTDSKKGG